MSLTTGSAATRSGPLDSAASPRSINEVVAAPENGISAFDARVSDGAAVRRSASTGVAAPENERSSTIVERSSVRKRGSFCSPASRSAPRSAVASPAIVAWLMKSATLSRFAARALRIVSESSARRSSSADCLARIASTSLVSRSAGLPRSMISPSSSPRAARPAPRSLRISRKRSAAGSREMLLTRSRSIALPLFSSGSSRWPSPGSPSGITASSGGGSEPGARSCVGSHSTNFSPSSDCGRTRHDASSRKSWNAGSSIRSTRTALPGSGAPSASAGSSSRVTSMSATTPTFAPATRTSSPGTRNPALSKIARTS